MKLRWLRLGEKKTHFDYSNDMISYIEALVNNMRMMNLKRLSPEERSKTAYEEYERNTIIDAWATIEMSMIDKPR